jgi:hypothetical protein
LGARLVEAGRLDEGMQRYHEVETRFPRSEWALRSKKARADVLLRRGRAAEARVLYEELQRSADPIARAGGNEGIAAVGATRLRGVLITLALIWIALFVAFHGYTGRRHLRPVPVELLYYLPVAGLFALAGATENASIAWATGGLAGGGALITWAAAAGTRARDAMASLERVARALALMLAVLAVAYVVIQWSGLSDLVVETFKAGPER